MAQSSDDNPADVENAKAEDTPAEDPEDTPEDDPVEKLSTNP